ncbi:SPOR domain-containing protein [Lysobacter sp. S4-A87]|uniref:SPOR domain-containing protein n=1 Tax=Lysobacter sp. S4-A87 TaxID=2925843 RepID=UPI001F5361D9|nr:SPOR domain-containing protein [Lysobacter sp. S4-A87]UNK48807.1 SPOR domain-containing protein [Lysobacter sp. S4-A87]
MLIRALVVLLIVLNLGVAAWWTLRAPPPTPAAIEQPLGVARLQLASEARTTAKAAPAAAVPAETAPVTAPAPPPAAAVPPTAATPPAQEVVAAKAAAAMPAQCYSFGPFADAAAAKNAHEVLMAVATKVVPRETRSGTTRGWRVLLPAAASLADAQATAQRIAAAGFGDYFIVREGSEANSIALGRYRSEDSANRRAQSLVAAGFPARAEPLGEGRASYWLDLVPGPSFDPARAQAAVQVAPRPLDCTRLK